MYYCRAGTTGTRSKFQLYGDKRSLSLLCGLPKEKEEVKLNTNILHYKQLRVFGCTRASLAGYRTSAQLVASGRIPLKKLITKCYTINEFPQALENAVNAVGLKNVIVFDESF